MKKALAIIGVYCALSAIPCAVQLANARLEWFVKGAPAMYFSLLMECIQMALGAIGGLYFCRYWYKKHPQELAGQQGTSSAQQWRTFVFFTVVVVLYWLNRNWQNDVIFLFVKGGLYWDAPWWRIYLFQTLATGEAWVAMYLFGLCFWRQKCRLLKNKA